MTATMPISAEVTGEARTRFRVWASSRRKVELVIEGRDPVPLAAEDGGYHSVEAANAPHGTRYRYRLDGEETLYPDPASRAQPDGPHGASQVIDPHRFAWTDTGFPGAKLEGQVIYEMHVGTFTADGTWESATRALERLVDLGVTTIEMMPVADFPGSFGWGYDGVALFAPYHGYGTPDDLRRFVDRAHALGLAVILDVVYNHIGPDGNYLGAFAKQYFDEAKMTEWGPAIRYSGEEARPVREFFVANAAYWIREFHFDGLRFDATQCIWDDSADHVLAEMARAAREAASGREIFMVAENESQEARVARPKERGGYGLDGLWNDDYHHVAIVALTGRREAYYLDYAGTARELVAAILRGYLFQGQYCSWQKKTRGTPSLDLLPHQFITYLENHDQVSNSARGLRLHQLTSPGKHRAMTALFLLGPGTPMLFQGQEDSTPSPFLFFANHNPDLAMLVRKGRADFLAQFPSAKSMRDELADPGRRETFEACKLAPGRKEALALHKDLLALRREQPRRVDAAVLADDALVLRAFGEAGDDRILLVNLGRDLALSYASEPLLAPPEGARFAMRWSSDDPRYGGTGAEPVQVEGAVRLPSETATLLVAKRS